ncbi:cytochrome c [Tistrella mobilis]|uniref:cytochrome c n=1 Tax=Tistrella mobilis TaxID=171437 RepID=UPI0035564001
MRRRLILGVLALLVVAVAVIVAIPLLTGAGPIPPATVDPARLDAGQRARLVERGRYIARAADCAACHVAEDGRAYAGGLPMETPVGTIYGTNITPSRDHGIGGWTSDDLYRALVYGILPDGGRLYPAMPYTSYHAMTRADVDALAAYLASLPAVEKPNRPPDLAFPFNIRPAIAFWNLIFRPEPGDLPPPAGTAAPAGDHARGRYLVEVLGHCGECHTPRNLAYAMEDDRHLQGEVIEGALAPDITPTGLSARGWTAEDLTGFLSTGLSPQGTMTFRMYPVLHHSTRYLTAEDVGAIAAYLTDGAPPPTRPEPVTTGNTRNAGHDIYLGFCAGCHGADGEGHPAASPPLATNTTAMLQDPRNLVKVIRDGIPARPLAGTGRMQEMPAFGDLLDDGEMAALVNYLRHRWGGQPGDVTAERVSEVGPR